jgi:hypothetical protein
MKTARLRAAAQQHQRSKSAPAAFRALPKMGPSSWRQYVHVDLAMPHLQWEVSFAQGRGDEAGRMALAGDMLRRAGRTDAERQDSLKKYGSKLVLVDEFWVQPADAVPAGSRPRAILSIEHHCTMQTHWKC